MDTGMDGWMAGWRYKDNAMKEGRQKRNRSRAEGI